MNDVLVGARAFSVNFLPLITTGISVFAGLWIIASSLKMLATAGEDRGMSNDGIWGRIGFRLLIGAMLLQFSTTMNDVSELLFGSKIQDYHGVLAYVHVPNGGSGMSVWKGVIDVCLMWVVLLGWVSALRGFFKWNEAASGGSSGSSGDPFWQGLWHIVGGAAAINISGVVSGFLGK